MQSDLAAMLSRFLSMSFCHTGFQIYLSERYYLIFFVRISICPLWNSLPLVFSWML